jgi:hypothetical protein
VADIYTEADGLPAQWDSEMAWDTRIRLPIAENGAALIRVIPHVNA